MTASMNQNSEYRLISLTQGQFAKVSPHHYEWLMQWKWQAKWTGTAFYAGRPIAHPLGRRTLLYMHRHILQLGPFRYDPRHADHTNGDTLDNTAENLRIATASQQQANRRLSKANTSGVRGVSWSAHAMKWRAAISANGKAKNLGYFDDLEAARQAYVRAAQEAFGQFARTG